MTVDSNGNVYKKICPKEAARLDAEYKAEQKSLMTQNLKITSAKSLANDAQAALNKEIKFCRVMVELIKQRGYEMILAQDQMEAWWKLAYRLEKIPALSQMDAGGDDMPSKEEVMAYYKSLEPVMMEILQYDESDQVDVEPVAKRLQHYVDAGEFCKSVGEDIQELINSRGLIRKEIDWDGLHENIMKNVPINSGTGTRLEQDIIQYIKEMMGE